MRINDWWILNIYLSCGEYFLEFFFQELQMKRDLFLILFITLSGMLGSIIIGLIFFNTSIFSLHSTTFVFITAGFYGALFFSMLQLKTLKEQILVMLMIYIFNLVVFSGKHLIVAFVIRDLFWLGSLFLSLKLYHLFIKNYPNVIFYLRSLALALIFGLLNIGSGIILFFIMTGQQMPSFNFIYYFAKNGVLIGVGIPWS